MDNIVSPDFTNKYRRHNRTRSARPVGNPTRSGLLERFGLVYDEIVVDGAPLPNSMPETTSRQLKQRFLRWLGVEYRILIAEPRSYEAHMTSRRIINFMVALSMASAVYAVVVALPDMALVTQGMLIAIAGALAAFVGIFRQPRPMVRLPEDA